MKPRALFESISAVAPEFKVMMAEHLKDYDELLAHVLMADLLRYVGARVSAPERIKELKLILDLLEEALRDTDPETEEVIAASFIEHIETEPFFGQLEPLLGPTLRAEHRRQVGSDNAR